MNSVPETTNVVSATNEAQTTTLPFVKVDEARIQEHLDDVVRRTVEETLNALLDAEADQLCGAKRYERSAARKNTRAGHYTRQLQTKAGEVELKVPKLRNLPFETAIIERYRRRESSVEEALVEMYLAGVSVRRVEDITEALWGARVSGSTVSELNKKIYAQIHEWRNRPIEGKHPYVYLDGIWLKRSWGGEVKSVAVLVAVGVNEDGFREVLGVMEGAKEDKDSWTGFLRYLKGRGLQGVRLGHAPVYGHEPAARVERADGECGLRQRRERRMPRRQGIRMRFWRHGERRPMEREGSPGQRAPGERHHRCAVGRAIPWRVARLQSPPPFRPAYQTYHA